MVKAFADKPVKFLAVAAGDNLGEASAYVAQNRLNMPVFADNLGLMERRYGFQISLQNIWQYRVIGPNGAIAANNMDEATINRVLAQSKVEWKYKGKGYDAKLDPAINAFEWGQYALGNKLLAAGRKSVNKALAESANKLYAAVKSEGARWKAEADGLAGSDPVKAYDLYQKVVASFPGDELAKEAAAAAGKLAKEKPVAAELAARKVYLQLEAALGRLTPAQKPLASQQLAAVAKKYAGTPTADKASALAKELE